MKLSESVKPMSYLRRHAAEALREVHEGQRPMEITHYGKARAVLQDFSSYQQTLESLALLKTPAQSADSISEGRSKPVKSVFSDIRQIIKGTTG